MGRPREFAIEKALDTAGELFWRKGYVGTSLSDLTGAIGITPPSFYSAFGSKEKLFKKVVDRYQSSHLGFFAEALNQETCCAAAGPGSPMLCCCANNSNSGAQRGWSSA
jgi:AcrR family transcriptional regulator